LRGKKKKKKKLGTETGEPREVYNVAIVSTSKSEETRGRRRGVVDADWSSVFGIHAAK
jgi:hypothetical protein